ncbi:MAG: MFS transporter [Thermodesulfobacteriota bacterium]|nr:MFS transporter [Thermodesulfobacteriota bacterium]
MQSSAAILLPRGFKYYRWWIFLILGIAYFLVYFHRLSLSVVADDLVHDFNASAGAMGLLASIYFYCYAVMQLPAGLLSDSIGPRRTVTLFLTIAAAGSILFGMAPGIEIAFMARVLVGFGVSMVFIPTMKILSQWYREDEFASMAGLLNAIGGIGVLAGTGMLGVLATAMGWRFSFELIGICTIVVVVMAWLVVRDRPQAKGWPAIQEISTSAGKAAPPAAIPLLDGARRVVTEKHFWPVAVWFFFDCGIFFGFGGLWGGPYLMHAYNMSRAEAGAVLSMIAWGMILGSPFIGFVSDRLLKSRKKPFIICSATLAAVMLFLYLHPAGLSRPVLYAVFFVFSIAASAIVIVGFTTTKELFPVAMAGTSVGTVNLFPFLGGAVYMPFLGRVLDRASVATTGDYAMEGYTLVLFILFVSALVALGAAMLMKETFPGSGD